GAQRHREAAVAECLRRGLAAQAVRIGEPIHLALADQLPVEVLRLAVEEEAVILREIRAEKAVGTIRRRELAHAAKRGEVGPVEVALLGGAKPPDQERGVGEILRSGHLDQRLREDALRIRLRTILRRLAVVVEKRRLERRRALETALSDPGEVDGGID